MKVKNALKLPPLNNLKANLPVATANLKAGVTQGLAARVVASGRDPKAIGRPGMVPLPQTLKASIGHKVENLKSQLTEVELDIKKLLEQIETKRVEEASIKDSVESRDESRQAISINLQKAVDAIEEMRRAISSLG